MSLLRSLSFTVEVPSEVYEHCFQSLITKRDEMPLETLDYSLEIIDNALDGRIDFTREEFNLKGYVKVIRRNEKMGDSRANKKKVYLYHSEDDYSSDNVSGIAVSQLKSETDEYEKFVDEDEVKYAIIKLDKVYETALIYHEVDLYTALYNALRGIPSAIAAAKELCERCPYIADLIYIILNSGKSFQEMFPDKVVELERRYLHCV